MNADERRLKTRVNPSIYKPNFSSLAATMPSRPVRPVYAGNGRQQSGR
jgi:hypothetical protein